MRAAPFGGCQNKPYLCNIYIINTIYDGKDNSPDNDADND